MIQKEKYDKVILEKIKKGDFIVDSDSGFIFGKTLNDENERKRIGSVLSGKNRFTCLVDGKTLTYPSCRAIYLSNKEIPDGMEVFHKNGNMLDDRLSNLDVRKPTITNYYGKRWSGEDDLVLKKEYKEKSYGQLSERFNRSEHAIRARMAILGLTKEDKRKKWTEEEDKILLECYKNPNITIEEISRRTGRGESSVRMRANRTNNIYRSDMHLRPDLNEKIFYLSIKSAKLRETLRARCCLCGYEKHIQFHHIDGNNKNHHISNIASLCPNHHAEITHGEKKDLFTYSIWQRVYSSGEVGELKNNIEQIKAKTKTV